MPVQNPKRGKSFIYSFQSCALQCECEEKLCQWGDLSLCPVGDSCKAPQGKVLLKTNGRATECLLADWNEDGTGAAAPTHLPVGIQKASLRGCFQGFCCCCQARRCRSPSLPHQPPLWRVLLAHIVQLSLAANSWLFWKCSSFPFFGWPHASPLWQSLPE